MCLFAASKLHKDMGSGCTAEKARSSTVILRIVTMLTRMVPFCYEQSRCAEGTVIYLQVNYNIIHYNRKSCFSAVNAFVVLHIH